MVERLEEPYINFSSTIASASCGLAGNRIFSHKRFGMCARSTVFM